MNGWGVSPIYESVCARCMYTWKTISLENIRALLIRQEVVQCSDLRMLFVEDTHYNLTNCLIGNELINMGVRISISEGRGFGLEPQPPTYVRHCVRYLPPQQAQFHDWSCIIAYSYWWPRRACHLSTRFICKSSMCVLTSWEPMRTKYFCCIFFSVVKSLAIL